MFIIKYHNFFIRNVLTAFFFLFVIAGNAKSQDFDPVSLYLTWQNDPTTTMTIDWHTTPDDQDRKVVFQYKKKGDNTWFEISSGAIHSFTFPYSDRMIHRVEIRFLEPDTEYRFKFGDNSRAYSFRTMPDDITGRSIRFATGGDTSHRDEWFRKVNQEVMKYEPDFILWGGDLSYANEEPTEYRVWEKWFESIKETLVFDDGRVVPIVVAIGNHELFGERRLYREGHPLGAHDEDEAQAFMSKHNIWNGKPAYFQHLFAFPGDPTYGVLDFSNYMSVIALDTDHAEPVEGLQTVWLEEILKQRESQKHIFPVYHVPGYPSVRSYVWTTSTRVRENWVPLFSKAGVRVAFENHDHSYKRTKPMLSGEIVEDGEGIVFIGDGAWGVGTRELRFIYVTIEEVCKYNIDPGKIQYVADFDLFIIEARDLPDDYPSEFSADNIPYLETFASERHAIIIDVSEDGADFKTVNEDGEVIDTYYYVIE